MLHFRVPIGVFLVTALAGCGGSSSPAPSAPTPSPPAAVTVTIPSGASSLGTAAFVPNPVTVSVGTTVTWSNTDPVSSSHDVVGDNGAYDSGLVVNGARYSFTFQSRGTFPYHCSRHPSMVGTVVAQ